MSQSAPLGASGAPKSKDEIEIAKAAAAIEKHPNQWWGKEYLVLRDGKLKCDTLTWGEWLGSKFGGGRGAKLHAIIHHLKTKTDIKIQENNDMQKIIGSFLGKKIKYISNDVVGKTVDANAALTESIVSIVAQQKTIQPIPIKSAIDSTISSAPIDVLLSFVKNAIKQGNIEEANYLLSDILKRTITNKEELSELVDCLDLSKNEMREVFNQLRSIKVDEKLVSPKALSTEKEIGVLRQNWQFCLPLQELLTKDRDGNSRIVFHLHACLKTQPVNMADATFLLTELIKNKVQVTSDADQERLVECLNFTANDALRVLHDQLKPEATKPLTQALDAALVKQISTNTEVRFDTKALERLAKHCTTAKQVDKLITLIEKLEKAGHRFEANNLSQAFPKSVGESLLRSLKADPNSSGFIDRLNELVSKREGTNWGSGFVGVMRDTLATALGIRPALEPM